MKYTILSAVVISALAASSSVAQVQLAPPGSTAATPASLVTNDQPPPPGPPVPVESPSPVPPPMFTPAQPNPLANGVKTSGATRIDQPIPSLLPPPARVDGPIVPAVPPSVIMPCPEEARQCGWATVDYLLWWVKPGPMPNPLVTTGPATDNPPGAVGQPNTTVLFGEHNLDYGTFSGGRFSAGFWLPQCPVIGIEGSFLGLQSRSVSFSAFSDLAGDPVLARPVIVTNTSNTLVSTVVPVVIPGPVQKPAHGDDDDGSHGNPHLNGVKGNPHVNGNKGNPHQDGAYGNPHVDGAHGNPHQDGACGNPHTLVPSDPNQPTVTKQVVNNTETVYLDSAPGIASGAVNVSSTTQFDSWEINLAANMLRTLRWNWDMTLGFRGMDLTESLGIQDVVAPLSSDSGFTFLGQPVSPPSAIADFDHFRASNHFYGGQLGSRVNWYSGPFDVSLVGKIALGATQQVITVDGGSLLLTPGAPPVSATGGILAQPSNIARSYHSAFSVVPEADLNVGYQITHWLRAQVGYSFIYWSDVVRPGNQIDRTVNPTQVPTDQNFGPLVGPARPILTPQTTSFWAQGINFGLEFRF